MNQSVPTSDIYTTAIGYSGSVGGVQDRGLDVFISGLPIEVGRENTVRAAVCQKDVEGS